LCTPHKVDGRSQGKSCHDWEKREKNNVIVLKRGDFGEKRGDKINGK